MSLVHYVVMRRDLTLGEFAAQLTHGGEAYALRRDIEGARGSYIRREGVDVLEDPRSADIDLSDDFEYDKTTAIVKGARNEAKLLKVEKLLIDAKVPHVAIREETGPKGGRLAGQLTCVSVMPTEDADGKVRALLSDFVFIEKLDGPKAPPAPVTALPLPSIVDGTPRRCRIDLATPAEHAIREALAEVELVGADPLLTVAVILLSKARENVADFLERAPA